MMIDQSMQIYLNNLTLSQMALLRKVLWTEYVRTTANITTRHEHFTFTHGILSFAV